MRKLKAGLLSVGILLFGGGILSSLITPEYWVVPAVTGSVLLFSGMVVSWIEEYQQKKLKK